MGRKIPVSQLSAAVIEQLEREIERSLANG